MASRLFGNRYTVPATATSLSTLLGETAVAIRGRTLAGSIALRAEVSNIATIYFGPSTVTAAGVNAFGFIRASEFVSYELAQGQAPLTDLFIIGNGVDLVYAAGVEY